MSGIYMDFPEWSPEQRVALAVAEMERNERVARSAFSMPTDDGLVGSILQETQV